MDGDGDDLETSCGDRGGMGIRVTGTVGDGYKYLSPCSSVVGRSSIYTLLSCTPLRYLRNVAREE